MLCPNCGNQIPEDQQQCCFCVPKPPEKKGRLWPPLVWMAVMLCIGLVVFFATIDRFHIPASCSVPWFTVREGVLYFDSELYTGSEELVVPSVVNGETVTALGAESFRDCTLLTTLSLPDPLERIDRRAFAGCTSLRGLRLPGSLKHIGPGAFEGCTALEALCIPGSVEVIGNSAFIRCPKLRHIFYAGTYKNWIGLYSQKIAPNTHIYTTDGEHTHGSAAP